MEEGKGEIYLIGIRSSVRQRHQEEEEVPRWFFAILAYLTESANSKLFKNVPNSQQRQQSPLSY